ncbi:MAG TPA: hypothetical protein VHE99_02270 [Gammaproteobacteria bacterium]|nr:hypothetical protein [Gammaproteobacteria bacterium]
MPNSIDLSSFENFLSLINPLINPDPPKRIPTPAERKAALPKEEEYEIYGFFQSKNKELSFTNRRTGEKMTVTADNYQDIYQTMTKHHVYLELRNPSFKYLSSKKLMAEAIKNTSQLITDNSTLLQDLADISAEYSLTGTDIHHALTQLGVFKAETKPIAESKTPPIATTDSLFSKQSN